MTALPSRRAVLRAAAWTVPAVSVVAAAPAHAASQVSASSAAVTSGTLTVMDPFGGAVDATVRFTPAPTSTPQVSVSVDNGPAVLFGSLTPLGGGSFRGTVDYYEGDFWGRASVPVAVYTAGYSPGVGSLTVVDGGGIP